MAANQLMQARINGAIKEEAADVLIRWIPNATTIAAMMEARVGNLPRADSIEELKKSLHADD